jgi:DNA polymerase-1
MAQYEAEHQPRWILPAAEELYPTLLRAGIRLVFGDTPVKFPLDISTVDCYADAK